MACPSESFICDPFRGTRYLLSSILAAVVPEPFLTIALTALAIAMVTTIVAVIVMSQTWAERRIVGFLQGRLGPNRVGPAGLLQPVADGIKLLMKETIIPAQADRIAFLLAPLIVVIPSLAVWVIIPWGPGLAVTDLNIGVLFILAIGAVPTIGILMAGWGSGNKYSLLGGMRAAAQLISYEIPMIITVLVPVLLAGSMSLGRIVELQSDLWFVLAVPGGTIAFLLFLVAGIAEINRSPFDLPEAESEIVAGFHTEYSSMGFALFFLAEYANAFALSALAAILFLGGWQGPLLPPFVLFFAKSYLVFFLLVWVRGTLPRVRYDQLMQVAWKAALPASLVTVGITAGQLSLGLVPGA